MMGHPIYNPIYSHLGGLFSKIKRHWGLWERKHSLHAQRHSAFGEFFLHWKENFLYPPTPQIRGSLGRFSCSGGKALCACSEALCSLLFGREPSLHAQTALHYHAVNNFASMAGRQDAFAGDSPLYMLRDPFTPTPLKLCIHGWGERRSGHAQKRPAPRGSPPPPRYPSSPAEPKAGGCRGAAAREKRAMPGRRRYARPGLSRGLAGFGACAVVGGRGLQQGGGSHDGGGAVAGGARGAGGVSPPSSAQGAAPLGPAGERGRAGPGGTVRGPVWRGRAG